MIEEDRLIEEVTGNRPVTDGEMMLAAWRGQEAETSELIGATAREATARGLGGLVNLASYASAVLYNGLGRHDAAREVTWRVFERDPLGYGPLSCPTLDAMGMEALAGRARRELAATGETARKRTVHAVRDSQA